MHVDLAPFATAEGLVALATLTALEIVLGIDNIVFISILTGKLPPEKQAAARRTGLFVAMFTRIALLLFISFIMGLVKPVFEIPAFAAIKDPIGISGKDLILLLIGVVLVAEGLHQHISKGYIYFAMAFSLAVEMLNLRVRKLKAGAAAH
jgi:predicted tellurium resistance membrane protein TerC